MRTDVYGIQHKGQYHTISMAQARACGLKEQDQSTKRSLEETVAIMEQQSSYARFTARIEGHLLIKQDVGKAKRDAQEPHSTSRQVS